MIKYIQLTYAAILGAIILPFILARDIAFYRFRRGSFDAAERYWNGLRLIVREYECVKARGFRWMPLYYVQHTDTMNRQYCRVLYGGVCWWDSFGGGPGYIGGYAIVLTGCLDGWKWPRGWSRVRALVTGRV